MIIRFFKSNTASAFFLLPFIAIAIWVFGFVAPQPLTVNHAMPLYDLLAMPLAKIQWLSSLVALILVLAEAFILNYIVNENEVLTKKTNLTALFYLVFMSNNNAMLELHPLIFSNLFLLFALSKIFNSYRKDTAFSQFFDTGLLISIASLFYFPCIVFFPVIGISLIIFRPFNWREWAISFVGVLVPYIFVFTWYFWNNQLQSLFFDKFIFPMGFKRPSFDLSQSFYFLITVGWIIVILSFGKLFSGLGSGAQKTKKAITLTLWLFLFSILSLFLAPAVSTVYFSLLAIPAAIICSNYFLKQKKELWGEILFLLLLVGIFTDLIATIF